MLLLRFVFGWMVWLVVSGQGSPEKCNKANNLDPSWTNWTIDTQRCINLNISNNSLTSLRKGLFNYTVELITLDLSHNKLLELPAGLFIHTVKLKNIYISNNELTTISRGLFCNLTELVEISLKHNSIRDIDSKAFTGLKKLEMIDLSFNNIIKTEWISPILQSRVKVDQKKRLLLAGNRFECDCQAQELFDLLKSTNAIIEGMRCFEVKNCPEICSCKSLPQVRLIHHHSEQFTDQLTSVCDKNTRQDLEASCQSQMWLMLSMLVTLITMLWLMAMTARLYAQQDINWNVY